MLEAYIIVPQIIKVEFKIQIVSPFTINNNTSCSFYKSLLFNPMRFGGCCCSTI